MVDIAALNSSFLFWDTTALWIGVVGLAFALGQMFIEFTDFVRSKSARFKYRVAFGIALIATTGGQLLAQVKTNMTIGAITAYLNDEAAKANRAADGLRLDVQVQQGKNLEFEAKNLDLEKRLAQSNSNLIIALRKTSDKVDVMALRSKPRELDDAALKKELRSVSRDLRKITIIRLNDPIAGAYADNIIGALGKLNWGVKMEPLPSSELVGVIVCGNNSGDVKVGKALIRAGIVAKIVSSNKPIFCDSATTAPQTPPGLLGKIARTVDSAISLEFLKSTQRGTVIFVGANPPLS